MIYAAAKNGWAVNDMDEKVRPRVGVNDLLDVIVNKIPHPVVDQNADLKMLIQQTESNKYFGKMLIGRIQQGKLSVGERIQAVSQDGEIIEQSKVLKISKKFGMHELDLQTAYAGDIVSIAGFNNGTVGHTMNTLGQNYVIPAIRIDPPTLSLNVTFNDSPLKGIDGDKITISQIKERLVRES